MKCRCSDWTHLEWLHIFDRIFCRDANLVIVEVDQDIFTVAHAKLMHVRKLTQTVTAFHTLDHVVLVTLIHGKDHIDACRVNGTDIQRGKDTNVWCYDWLGSEAFAIAGN